MHVRYRTLITAAELRTLVDAGAAPLLFDASFDLGDPGAGERAHEESHVAGSHYVHLDRDLCAARSGTNGRHPLPRRDAFATTAGRLGVEPGRQVVALDGQGGMYASRLWWMLRWLGHGEVAVLDGGIAAWRRGGGAMTTTPTTADPRPAYPSLPALETVALVDEVLHRSPGVALVDARSAERFRGESEPIDKVAGHIPGALNRFHKANLDEGGTFKAAAALREEFAMLLGSRPPEAVIHSCGSGVTACHNLLAMAHAGLGGSRLYAGSWSEWSADPARAIGRG